MESGDNYVTLVDTIVSLSCAITMVTESEETGQSMMACALE